MKIAICPAALLLLSCGSQAAHDFARTWVGGGITYSPERIGRTPRQTIEIRGSGKELGELAGRRSRTPLKAVVEAGTGRSTPVGRRLLLNLGVEATERLRPNWAAAAVINTACSRL